MCGRFPDLVAFVGDAANGTGDSVGSLQVGTEYVVAAAAFGPSMPWFFLIDHLPGLRTPILVPCLQVEIVDSRMSKLWVQGTWRDRFNRSHSLLAPSCWASDPIFHGRLFEGESVAMEQMDIYRMEILLEFPLPWVQRKAIAVGSGSWVTDDEWTSQWEVDRSRAMTVNPVNSELYHNPLYEQT